MKLKTKSIWIFFLLFAVGHLCAEEMIKQQDGLSNQQLEQMERLQKLQEQQSKVLEGMTINMPSLTGAIMSMGERLEKLKRNRHELVEKQVNELDQKAEEVLTLIDQNQIRLAKLKLLSINWNPIGDKAIDEEKTKHYQEVRSLILSMLKD